MRHSDPTISPAAPQNRLRSNVPSPQLANNVPRRPLRSLDGVRTVPLQPRPKIIRSPRELQQPTKQIKLQASKKPRKASKLQKPLLVLAIVAGGFLIQQSAAIGGLCIVMYTVVALKQRIASRLTFILALFAFVGVLALLFFRANQALAMNFALYAFLLLVVAVLSLTREILSTKTPGSHR